MYLFFKSLRIPALLSLISISAHAFNVGFNQGWIEGGYAVQWGRSHYNPTEARRLLDLTRGAGGKSLRMWLFEGVSNNSLLWRNGVVVGVSSDFLANFEDFLRAAKARGVQVYPTLFDGNLLRQLPAGPDRDRWWNLLNNVGGARQQFEQAALTPLLKLLYRAEFRSVVFGLDVMNEIDAAELGNRFARGWTSVNEFTCGIRDHVRQRRGGAAAIPVTASIGWPTIPFYHRGAANLILDPNPHPNCVDYWDIHFYSDQGAIENCSKIGELARRYGKKVYLGEFGQKSGRFSDSLQLTSTQNFLQNARACGFSGALAWRLSDIRSGHNEEARFSYEANGGLRPAYDYIKRWNQAQ